MHRVLEIENATGLHHHHLNREGMVIKLHLRSLLQTSLTAIIVVVSGACSSSTLYFRKVATGTFLISIVKYRRTHTGREL